MWDPATDFGQVLTPATIDTYLNDINSILRTLCNPTGAR